jgi:hypothetical protein
MQTSITRRDITLIRLKHITYPLVRHIALDNRPCIVGRAVIDNAHLKILKSLMKDTLKKVADKGPVVIRSDDDAELYVITHIVHRVEYSVNALMAITGIRLTMQMLVPQQAIEPRSEDTFRQAIRKPDKANNTVEPRATTACLRRSLATVRPSGISYPYLR